MRHFPLHCGNRIYADFSGSYRGPFERVLDHIHKSSASSDPLPVDKRMIPLDFSSQVYLREVPFESEIRGLLAEGGVQCAVEQFVAAPDPTYDKLRTAFLARLDNVRADPYYSHSFEQSLEHRYQSVRMLERVLPSGIREIVNHLRQPGFGSSAIVGACKMFARIVRAVTMCILV